MAGRDLPVGELAADSSLSLSLLDQVRTSGESLLSGDLTREEGIPDTTSLLLCNIRSVLIVPVSHALKGCRGLLYADSQARHVAFNYTDLLRTQQLARSLQKQLWGEPDEPARPVPKKRAAATETKVSVKPEAPTTSVTMKPVNARQRAVLIRSLATLLESGVPIQRALYFLSRPAGQPGTETLAAFWLSVVERGEPLSQAMQGSGQPPLAVSMVRAAERSGALVQVLLRLADYFEYIQGVRHKIGASLVYPCFVLALCSLVLMLLLKNPLLIGLALLVSWAVGWLLLRPPLAALARRRDEALFSYLLAMQLEVGIGILPALSSCAESCPHLKLETAMAALQDGATLRAALTSSGSFSRSTLALLTAGEESGHLARSLGWCSRLMQMELECAIARTLSLIEPAVMLLLGNLVGFIAFSALKPMIKMVQDL